MKKCYNESVSAVGRRWEIPTFIWFCNETERTEDNIKKVVWKEVIVKSKLKKKGENVGLLFEWK